MMLGGIEALARGAKQAVGAGQMIGIAFAAPGARGADSATCAGRGLLIGICRMSWKPSTVWRMTCLNSTRAQLAGLVQYPLVDVHLADVVQQAAQREILQVRMVQRQSAAQHHAVEGDVDRVLEGVVVVALE